VYADSSNHLRFRALSFRIVYATHAATLVGRGMLDGRKVAFVAHAFDGHPRFLIAWSGGKPRGGAVTDGGIVIS
jgi:hypothetical protein